jgi:hypothetical protein
MDETAIHQPQISPPDMPRVGQQLPLEIVLGGAWPSRWRAAERPRIRRASGVFALGEHRPLNPFATKIGEGLESLLTALEAKPGDK